MLAPGATPVPQIVLLAEARATPAAEVPWKSLGPGEGSPSPSL
jgi:hypothetical protein